MLPMDLTSTPFLKYHDIEVEAIDIYDDAWSFSSEFSDVLSFLGQVDGSPADKLAERLVGVINGTESH